MAVELDIQEYYRQLRAEVIERSHGIHDGGTEGALPDFKENVFTQIALEHLVELGVIEDGSICYFERKTGSGYIKVNGYQLDDEDGSLYLFTTMFDNGANARSLTLTEARQSFSRLERFLVWALKGHHVDMEPASDQHDMVRLIYETQKQITQVHLILLSNIQVPDKAVADPVGLVGGYTARYQVWDLVRLYRATASGLPYESIGIDFKERHGKPIECLKYPGAGDDYTTYLVMLPGDFLFKIYDEFGSRLLELNVRSFLQAKGKVNRGIRDTLRTEPGRFLAYNNGISVVVEDLELVSGQDGTLAIGSVQGLQIVNGGQTVASIHRARKVDRVDLSAVHVQAKVTVVSPERLEEIVPRITLYANSQNKVNEADFSSNDPYHVEIQRLAETTWAPGEQSRWFYERARGQYQAEKARQATTAARKRQFESKIPSSQKFTKTDLAKYLNTCDSYPHVVSRGSQKNFVQFMLRLRSETKKDWKPAKEYYQELVGKAILYRTAEKVVREQKIAAYRANVVAYTVAYMIFRTHKRIDFSRIWAQQKVSQGIQDSLRAFAVPIHDEIVRSAGSRNVTEWCKKEECWTVVRTLCQWPLENEHFWPRKLGN